MASCEKKTKICLADLMWLSKSQNPDGELIVNVVGADGGTHRAKVVEFGGMENGIYITVQE